VVKIGFGGQICSRPYDYKTNMNLLRMALKLTNHQTFVPPAIPAAASTFRQKPYA